MPTCNIKGNADEGLEAGEGMSAEAMALAIRTSYRPNTGPDRKRAGIERKLIMILLADCVADGEGTVIFSIQSLSDSSGMDPEIVHATITHLERAGYVLEFDHLIVEGWKTKIHNITVPSFAAHERNPARRASPSFAALPMLTASMRTASGCQPNNGLHVSPKGAARSPQRRGSP